MGISASLPSEQPIGCIGPANYQIWNKQCCESRKEGRGGKSDERDAQEWDRKARITEESLTAQSVTLKLKNSNLIVTDLCLHSTHQLLIDNESPFLRNWTSTEQKFVFELLLAHPQARNSPQYLQRLIDRVKVQYPGKTVDEIRNCCRYFHNRTAAEVISRRRASKNLDINPTTTNNVLFNT
jgi:hypothetical protein